MKERKIGPVEISLFDINNFNTYFRWGQDGVGFGELSLSVTSLGDVVHISGSTETMGKEWVRKALHALVDKIIDNVEDRYDERNFREDIEVTIPVPQDIIDERNDFLKACEGEITPEELNSRRDARAAKKK